VSYIAFRVPKKGAVPPGFTISYRERRLLYTARLLSVKVPGKRAPSRLPKGAPMERDALFKSLPLHILYGPSKRSPPSRFSWQRSDRERDALFPKPSIICRLETPVKRVCSSFSNGSPVETAALFQSLLLHIFRSPQQTRSPIKKKILHFSLKVLGKAAPLRGSLTESQWRQMPLFQSLLLYIFQSPQ
jgi:hypothetical protein